MTLEALKTTDYLVRKACELDYEGSPDAQKVIDMVNANEEAPLYTAGTCPSLSPTPSLRLASALFSLCLCVRFPIALPLLCSFLSFACAFAFERFSLRCFCVVFAFAFAPRSRLLSLRVRVCFARFTVASATSLSR
jgi:hypothetical protein